MVVHMGGELAPPKHTAVRTQQVMLGINVRMDKLTEDGTVEFEPRTESIGKVHELCSEILTRGACTPAEASKLRGMAQWCASNTFGRIGRLGLQALQRAGASLRT